MTKLNIKLYPDDILRKKVASIDKIGEKERKLACDMIETMRYARGVGLAGPQVGILKRIIVAEDIENEVSPIVLINPKIIKKKGKSRFCEGCLSVPGVTSDIVRPESIIVEALNLDGEKLKIEAGGFIARILQHEIDHLDGVLFIDRVSYLKRKKLIKEISSNVCMKL